MPGGHETVFAETVRDFGGRVKEEGKILVETNGN
jgi:hypothetical protein